MPRCSSRSGWCFATAAKSSSPCTTRPTFCAQTSPPSLSLNLRTAGAFAAQPSLRGATAAKIGYKIYVLVNADGVQYVGCTRTGMGSRIRLGHMRSKTPKNGYHGYKWLTQPGLQLYVFTLP